MSGKVTVVIGGQFGSEAKGTLIGHLTLERKFAAAVRTGAINAGHTVYYKGKPYAMQTIPVAWVDPDCLLVVGRGAYVDIELLVREARMIEEATGSSITDRLFVDASAGTQSEKHTKAEEEAGLHGRMGSTAHGCMEAQFDRMRRGADYTNFEKAWKGWLEKHPEDASLVVVTNDTAGMLNRILSANADVLVEGTQGFGLDLLHGHFPYVTSRPTGASHWLTEAGISPAWPREVVAVCRTYPIRVAGNSGPLEGEISWPALTRQVNTRRVEAGLEPLVAEEAIVAFEEMETKLVEEMELPCAPHLIPESERAQFGPKLVEIHKEVLKRLPKETVEELRKFFEITTVTKKLRRIAAFNSAEVKRTCTMNGVDAIALMFVNYEFPDVEFAETDKVIKENPRVLEYTSQIADAVGCPVRWLGISRTRTINI